MQKGKFFVTMLISFLCITFAVILARSKEISAKNDQDCTDKNTPTTLNKKQCYVYADNICRKGVWDESTFTCEAKGDIVPLLLLIVGGLSFLLMLYFAFTGKRKKY